MVAQLYMASYFQSLSFLFFHFLYCFTVSLPIQYSCPHDQSLLLLAFKQSFSIDESNSFSCESSFPKTQTWNKSTDCCAWEGVTCDKITSNVIELDLSCAQLNGSIDSRNSLFQLPHLQKLNLACNHISCSQSVMIFTNFSHLTHLNLSTNEFSGQVSSEISKLTELTSIDLSYNSFTVERNVFKLLLTNFTKLSQVYLRNMDILSSIPNNLSSSLEILQLAGNNLHGELPQSIFHLPKLNTLDLGGKTQLYGLLPSARWNSRTTLEWLDLSDIQFLGKIPDSFENLKALKYLDLSYCGFNGSLPQGIFMNMTQIEKIDLSHNRFTGSLPSFPTEKTHLKSVILAHNSFTGEIMSSGLLSLSSLEAVDISDNQLSGPIPKELSTLVNLRFLDLGSNNFSGHVDVDMFSNMKQLQGFGLSFNRLSLVSKINSTLPASISSIWLASCNITELEFLRSASALSVIDLSMNNIRGIPSWLWSKWNNILVLNISYNSISHTKDLQFEGIGILDIRSNLFQGQFPQVPTSIYDIFISDNQFSGIIPSSLVCSLSNLAILDVSNNSFTGSIPECIGTTSLVLTILDMHMNKFEGTIPTNFSSKVLTTLNLHGNHLRGNIPSSLATCMALKVLVLGNNYLNDSFPSWLGVLPNLRILSLRSNNLHGKIILSETNSFSKLQILDISHNHFIGSLPQNLFKSFLALMKPDETSKQASYMGNDYVYYMDSTTLVNKGLEVGLVKILTTWNTIDLSSNNFEGNIPNSVGLLISLRQLNFSNNKFRGEIPISMGNLSVLESLDLSSNQLTGTIPSQLATLHFLSKLNLSNNHLTGRIPVGSQFQTFENNSYIDNDGLCGIPLSITCGSNQEQVVDYSHDSEFFDGFGWRCVLIGYGVGMVIGSWIGFLMIFTETPKWFIRMIEKLEYRIVMHMDKKKKIIQGNARKN